MLEYIVVIIGYLVLASLITFIGVGIISVAVDLGILKLDTTPTKRAKSVRNRDDVA